MRINLKAQMLMFKKWSNCFIVVIHPLSTLFVLLLFCADLEIQQETKTDKNFCLHGACSSERKHIIKQTSELYMRR